MQRWWVCECGMVCTAAQTQCGACKSERTEEPEPAPFVAIRQLWQVFWYDKLRRAEGRKARKR